MGRFLEIVHIMIGLIFLVGLKFFVWFLNCFCSKRCFMMDVNKGFVLDVLDSLSMECLLKFLVYIVIVSVCV